MNDLNFTGGDNMGSVCRAFLSPVENITSLPDPIGGIAEGEPDFTGSNTWVEITFTDDTGRFKEDLKEGPGGPINQVECVGDVAGDDNPKREDMNELARHNCIVDVEDHNGLRRRMGTLRNPVLASQIQVGYDTGGGAAARNGYGLRITWKGDRLCVLVEDDDSGSASLS